MPNDPQPESAAPPVRRVLEPGTLVGRFRVEALLGTGGMGEVYRAWDPTLERSVALKALRAGTEREAGAPERFRREALALAQLNHPHVCQVHDWVDGPGATFIAMELLEGRTLDQAAQDLRPRMRLAVVRQVALALEAAHAKGLIHRDLKPSNVMVGPVRDGQEPHVKVLDFGLARLVEPQEPLITPSAVPSLALLQALEAADRSRRDEPETLRPGSDPGRQEGSGPHSWERLTQAGTFMGSPGYASPEQIQGQAAGPASDIFSLGILAWEMLAGEHPYPGEGRQRMRAIVEGRRRDLKARGLPSGTADLLRAMLDPHPFKRPTAARVAATLATLLRPRLLLRWAGASLAGALVLALGVNWFLGRGIISDLTRQRPARLAVLPFENHSGDPQLDSVLRLVLPEMVEASLREHPKLAPVDLETLARGRTALRLPQGAPLGPEDGARLATALGAQLLLQGSLSRGSDGSFILSYRLTDAQGAPRSVGEVREPQGRTAVTLPLARKLAAHLLKAIDPFGPDLRPLPELPDAVLDAYIRGSGLMDRGDFKEAAPAFQTAAQMAPDFAPAVLGYARCLSRLADLPPEPVFQWARWAARAQGQRAYEMKALHHLAVRHGDRGQWEASDRAGREALALALALKETTYEAGIRATLGVNLQRQHRTAEAEVEYQKALGIYRASEDRLNATRVLNNLAVVEKERGDLKGAERRYLDALDTVRTYGDRWGESIITNNLGDLALTQEGGLDRAEGFYRKALALRQAIGDQNGLAYTLMGLASVSQARGDLDRAEGLEREFLEQARRTRLQPLEALALYNLGELNRAAGRYEAARAHYRQSLVLHETLKDSVMEAHCLAGEAECLAREGRRGMARALLERSHLLSADETPYLLRAKAWLARTESKPEEAKALFTRALALARIQAPEIVGELKVALGGSPTG